MSPGCLWASILSDYLNVLFLFICSCSCDAAVLGQASLLKEICDLNATNMVK